MSIAMHGVRTTPSPRQQIVQVALGKIAVNLVAPAKFTHPTRFPELRSRLMILAEVLDRPLTVMVMGEFKSGKSTFINAFLNEELLKSDVTPATAVLTVVRYGRRRKLTAYFSNRVRGRNYRLRMLPKLTAEGDKKAEKLRTQLSHVQCALPDLRLQTCSLVDSPGLNSTHATHTATTLKYLGDAEVALWVFSYTSQIRASELAALESLPRSLPVLGIVNRIDEHDEEEDGPLPQVMSQLETRAGRKVPMIPVSAYLKLQASFEKDERKLEASRWSGFECIWENHIAGQYETLKFTGFVSKLISLLTEIEEEMNLLLGEWTRRRDILSQCIQFIDDLQSERSKLISAHSQIKRVTSSELEFCTKRLGPLLTIRVPLDSKMQMHIDTFEITLRALYAESNQVRAQQADLEASIRENTRMRNVLAGDWAAFNRRNWVVRTIDWNGTKQGLRQREATLDSDLAQLKVVANQIKARSQTLSNREVLENRRARSFLREIARRCRQEAKDVKKELKIQSKTLKRLVSDEQEYSWISNFNHVFLDSIQKNVLSILGDAPENTSQPSWAGIEQYLAQYTIDRKTKWTDEVRLTTVHQALLRDQQDVAVP